MVMGVSEGDVSIEEVGAGLVSAMTAFLSGAGLFVGWMNFEERVVVM